MATLVHLEAAAEALVAHLQAALDARLGAGVAVVMRGWPESQDYPVPGGSQKLRVAVTHGEGTAAGCSPAHIGQATYDGVPLQRYGIGNWTTTMQVDVFAALKPHRDEGGNVVADALSPRIVMGDSGLTLVSSGYHDDRVRFVPSGTPTNNDEAGVTSGRWQHTVSLRARGRLIRATAVPLIAESLVETGSTTLAVDSDGVRET